MKTLQKNLTKETLKIFWRHAKKYPWHVFGIMFGVVAHSLLQQYQPTLYKRLIDVLVLKGLNQNLSPAFHVIWLIFIVSVIRLAFARAFNFINNYFQPKVMADLNFSCFKYLHRHSYSFFNDSFVGSLVTKVKRYERSFEQIADQLTFELGRTFLDTLVILCILFFYNKIIALTLFVWVILYLILATFFPAINYLTT